MLSIIAIFISIVAIVEQNKGILFEKRASVYYETYDIYNKLSQIIRLWESIKHVPSKSAIVGIIFEYGSEEVNLLNDYMKIERQSLNDQTSNCGTESQTTIQSNSGNQLLALMDRFVDIYLRKYYKPHLIDDVKLLYSDKASDQVKDLYDTYDHLLLGIMVMDTTEIENNLQKANEILQSFEKSHVLKAMRKKLPH